MNEKIYRMFYFYNSTASANEQSELMDAMAVLCLILVSGAVIIYQLCKGDDENHEQPPGEINE